MEDLAEDCAIPPYDFGKKLFPCQVNGKINTLEFLEASTGVAKLVEKLGKAFSPLSSDILGNIEKIRKCYDKNPVKYNYIEDMILCEKLENNDLSIDALLWLRRALHFFLIFFQNIINDVKKSECLKEHMTSAYSQTLEPYHGWITRKLFKFFKNMVPNRSDLLSTITSDGKEEEKENLIRFLKIYIQGLAENVYHIISFYKEHNLDSEYKFLRKNIKERCRSDFAVRVNLSVRGGVGCLEDLLKVFLDVSKFFFFFAIGQMLGVFKRRLKPKRAREEKDSHGGRKTAHKPEAIVPVDVARIAPSQRQIHPLFEDKATLLTYDDGLPVPKIPPTPTPNLKRSPDDPSQPPKRSPPDPILTSLPLHPPSPVSAFHPAPNICVQGGRIEFIKSPSEGANLASRAPARGSADNKTKAASLSQCGLNPQSRCVVGVTRAQQTQVDFPDLGVVEEKCDFAKEFLEATVKELRRLLECEREAVQKERLAVTRLQRQLARRDATQRDVDRERRLRADIESRLRETVSESERYRETLAGLQREFSKMEDTVRTMLQYKTKCELLNQERVFLTAIYESRVVQFQNTIAKLEQENESLKQRLHLFEKIGTEEASTELLERLRSLETENAHLFQDADFQRKQYESCLDDIANQVVRALLSQKGLREEIGSLQRRIKELENQNHALADVLVEKLDKSSAFALPYSDAQADTEKNSSAMFPGSFSSAVCPQEQSATASSSSFSCRSGERKHLQRLLLSDTEDKSVLKTLSAIESLIVVPLQRPRSLSLHLHTSPMPLSAATAVTSKQCQNRKGKLTLVTLSKKPSEDEGNESPESGNRDEGYSTMSSDVQGLGETNELSKRELEDLKEASDETDVIADSTGEMTSTAVIEDMSDPDMFFIPLNLSLTINSRQSYPPSKKFLPFQHAMRSFSDSHLFLKLTAAGAVSPSVSPPVLIVDVLDRTHILKRSKPLTGVPVVKGRTEKDLEDSQSSTGSWCSGSWWDTEFFQHWLRLDETRLKQQQQRDMLQLQYDRTEIEEWSMSLSCEDVATSGDGEFCQINETPAPLACVKKSTSSPETSSHNYRSLIDEAKPEDEERWFREENDPRKSTWPMMSPGRSWGSASTNNFEDCHALNDCYFNETRSAGSPAVSEDPEESSAIDTDFTRDFYRLVKFESTKSLASNSSKSNGHCDLGLLNPKQSEFAQEREMALQSVLSFIVEQQKYCHHREEEDNESSSVDGYREDLHESEEKLEKDGTEDGVRGEEGGEVGVLPEQTQVPLFEGGRAVGVNDSARPNNLGNESTSVNNKNSDVSTCESGFSKEPVNKKTNGSLKKGNQCSAEREIITKLPVRNSKNRNLVHNCTKNEKSLTVENFSRSLEAIKARGFGDFSNQNKKQENSTLSHNSKHFGNSNQKQMSNSLTSSAHTSDAAFVHSKKTSPDGTCRDSPAGEKWSPVSVSKKQTDAPCVKPAAENKIPRLRTDPRVRGTKIPVFSSKKPESAAATKPQHLDAESPKPVTLKERDGDTNIPVLASRCGKSLSRSSPKNPKTAESRSSRVVVVDDASFHEKATSKDVINELNRMIRKGEDLTPSNGDRELKPLDMACCCPTGWVHVERDIDYTDPKARANLLDVMLASSGSSTGSASSTDSGGDEPVDYTHLHRLHRFRRQRKASATREQLGVLRYPLTSARPSIIGRDSFFVRYGDKEKEAVASFDFLDDLSTTSVSGCSSCYSLESNRDIHTRATASPVDQELPSPETDIRTPLTPTTPVTPSDESDKRTGDLVSFSDSCADSYPESVGSLEEQS